MTGFYKFTLRLCDSLAFRLRRRLRAAALRGTPAGNPGFDASETYELLRLLAAAPPQVIYDLGANRGRWTLLAKSLFPNAEVHGFEPLPEHCDAFLRNTAGLAAVKLHRTALGEATAELEMDITSFSDSASLLAPTEALARTYGVRPGRKIPVPVVRLDDWVEAHGLPEPDLLKLDLQGYELQALRGAPRCLQHARAVLLELSFHEYYAGQPSAGRVITHLEQAGFRPAALSPDIPAGQLLEQVDALFLRTP